MNPAQTLRTLGRLCLALAGLVLAHRAPAQAAATGSIEGRVLNSATGSYLGNAEVRIAGTDLVTTTTPDGRYLFTQVPTGARTVSVSYPGLDTLDQAVNVTASTAVNADFALTTGQYSTVVRLGEFVVGGAREGNARAIVDQRNAPNITNTISADAFGAVSEDNVGEFLKYMPGLTIDYVENDARTVRVRCIPIEFAMMSIVHSTSNCLSPKGLPTIKSFQSYKSIMPSWYQSIYLE